jgi:hypothetical protein
MHGSGWRREKTAVAGTISFTRFRPTRSYTKPRDVTRETRRLKDKAVASLRRATAAFNGLEDDGREATVLLFLQHAFEMLLKAALYQRGVRLFDRARGRSISFEKCVRLGREHLGLTEDQAGLLRTIDALRDDEQHWLGELSEGLLYVHARAAVTLSDDVLQAVFGERLAGRLPERVLPISTSPPSDLDVLIDEQYRQVQELLRPRRRQRTEARSLIRGLLAMEGHATEGVEVSERDVTRIERAARQGRPLKDVFPRLLDLGVATEGEGITVAVHFSKRKGAPVRFIAADDPREAAAVRLVDLERKYHISPQELADKLGLSTAKAAALRRYLGIADDDDRYCHVFEFGSQKPRRYSDNALREMRRALDDGVDIDEVWQTHGRRRTRARAPLSAVARMARASVVDPPTCPGQAISRPCLACLA